MKNIKLGIKLMGGFCLTAIVVLAVGLMARSQQNTMKMQLDIIAEQTSRGMEYALKVDSAVQEASSLMKLLLSPYLTKEDRAGMADKLAKVRTERQENRKKFENLAIIKEVEKEWADSMQTIDNNAAINNRLLKLSNEMLDTDILNPYQVRSSINAMELELRAAWANIADYVQRHTTTLQIGDENACKTGQWLANPGTVNPGLVSIAATIKPLHHTYHGKILQCKDLIAQGKDAEAIHILNEDLRPLTDDMIAELAKAREIAKKAENLFQESTKILLTEGVDSTNRQAAATDALLEKLKGIADAAVTHAKETADNGQNISLICMIIGVLLALTLGLFLTRMITKPLALGVDLAKAMSAGDLTGSVDINQRDEIGVLAKALNEMAASLRRMFGSIQNGVGNVDSSSTQLAALSGQMSTGTEQTASLSSQVAAAAEEMSSNQNTVAAAMEQASVNVNMVATAAEEMSATISEIAINSAKAKDITTEAVSQSRKASERVSELGRAADEIDKVTEVITEISEQTNLLALNATIEAARAGEAGKGFAVVANEIKDLAKQTAGATLDIKNKIASIQQATGVTVKEINEIQQVIGNVDRIVATIATAVEEQSATTKEIAQNVSQASAGITEVNENVAQSSTAAQAIAQDIARVSQSAKELSEAGGQVKGNSDHLKTVSDGLKKLVDQFKI